MTIVKQLANPMTIKAIYPGTFDPITLGHLDIIRRASTMFDEVIVAAAASSSKQPMFNLDERVALIENACSDLTNISVVGFTGLLVDFAKEHDGKVLVRGVRTIADFEYEMQLANMNRRLDGQLETIFLTPSEEFSFVSSSLVKDVARHGGDIAQFVPEHVNQQVLAKTSR